MTTFFTDYWWAIWGIVGATAFLGYRMQKRGGSEPFLRRLIYAVRNEADPSSSAHRPLNPKIVVLALVGVAVAIVANILVGMAGK